MAVADTLQELATDIQSAYTSISNKGGTIPANKNTNNLATAIGTIPSGIQPSGTIQITENGTHDVAQYAEADVDVTDIYSELLQKQRNTYLINPNATYSTDELDLKLPYFNSNSTMFYWDSSSVVFPFKKIKLEIPTLCGDIRSLFQVGNRFYANLKEIEFVNEIAPTDLRSFCYRNITIKKIKGTIDLTNLTAAGKIGSPTFMACAALEEIHFAKNSSFYSMNFADCSRLTDDSLVSIVNSLNETVTGQTLTLHATAKTNLQNIIGTVTLDETETYHIFTADEQGTVSLMDFATQTKGWTIA